MVTVMHPNARRLSDFVDGELERRVAQRVALHLAGCRRCSEHVWSLRQLDAAAAALEVPALRPEVWQRVAADRAAGEVMILPGVAGPRASSAARRRRVRSAASVLLVIFAAMLAALLLQAPALDADASELRFLPTQPQPGQAVHVRYRATARLSGEPVLVLRARWRTAQHPRQWWQAEQVTELVPAAGSERGVFVGTFRFPADAAYGVFAVEDPAAADVDHRGHAWELLGHEAAADSELRPTAAALSQRYHDAWHERNLELATRTAADLASLHPDHPLSHHMAFLEARRGEESAPSEAERARQVAVSRRLVAAAAADADFAALDALLTFAEAVGDTGSVRILHERLLTRFPVAPRTWPLRLAALAPLWQQDRAAYWAAVEALWHASAASPLNDIFLNGRIAILWSSVQRARQAGDAEAVLRWSERAFEWMPLERVDVPAALLAVPELRPDGIRLLRRYLEQNAGPDLGQRALTTTAALATFFNDQERAGAALALGVALIEDGDDAAGRPLLELAAELRWSPDLFRRVAAAYMAAGDTAAALRFHARAAVDPATPSSVRDSASLRFAGLVGTARWDAALADARRTMDEFTMSRGFSRRPVRGSLRLTDLGGRQVTLAPEHPAGTVVVFWSPVCPYSVQQLPALKALARRLDADGVRVVAVAKWTAGPASAELRGFVARNELDFPIYFDQRGDADEAFGHPGTPAYYVLDGTGTIRFEKGGVDAVLRQLDLLGRVGAQ